MREKKELIEFLDKLLSDKFAHFWSKDGIEKLIETKSIVEGELDKWNSPVESPIERLANFIMAEVPGEPSKNEGAVDTAIRIIRKLLKATP